jgi:hypothetical protein
MPAASRYGLEPGRPERPQKTRQMAPCPYEQLRAARIRAFAAVARAPPPVGVFARPSVSHERHHPSARAVARRRLPETTLRFDGASAPSGIDAICNHAGWTHADLAARLGVGAPVLNYYVRDHAPPWLAHALLGIAVVELGLSAERARELLGRAMPADSSAV